ncbi:hypothetical protein ABBQ38_013004 [Trebouxia sp. C0009 RCD-2024]
MEHLDGLKLLKRLRTVCTDLCVPVTKYAGWFLCTATAAGTKLKQLKAASRQAGVLAQQHHEPRMAVVTAANRPWYPCCFGTAACRHKVPAGVCAEFWQSWCLSCLFTGRRCLTVA